jgi:hypothetical protein
MTNLGQRPTSVTVVVVLVWISAFLDIAGGLLLLILSGQDEVLGEVGATSGESLASGIGQLVTGTILALVAASLGRGSAIARALVTTVMVVRIAFGVWLFVAFGTHQAVEALTTIGVAVAALALLWNAAAKDFYDPVGAARRAAA